MSANPYATFLGEADAMQVIAATSSRLVAVASVLSAEQADAPTAPGKWSVRQIVVHMADVEVAFAFRLRQGLAGVTIQPFDQDEWAKSYARYSLSEAVQTFSALRLWNVAFAKGLSDADKRKTVTHPERGEMTLWNIVEMMAGHDLNHLGQLERASAPPSAA